MDYPLAKEQAALALLIQEGRRELAALNATKEQFLEEREKEATERVTNALAACKKALQETEEYTEVFHVMNKEAQRLLDELKETKKQSQEAARAFKKDSEEARKALDVKAQELSTLSQEISLKRLQLEGEVDQIRFEKKALQDEQVKVDDKRKMLALTIQVLKKKGLWRQNETTTE